MKEVFSQRLKSRRFKLGLVFFVSFLDLVAFASVIPLVPILLLPTAQSIFPAEFPLQWRYPILGALLSTYPLAQILSSPLLGAFSDETSRKKVLLISYVGNSLGYLLFAWGVLSKEVPLLFLGNFLAGITGGNISTANAIISDLTFTQKRSRYFGLSNLVLGMAFILGPFVAQRMFTVFEGRPSICFFSFLICSSIAFTNFILVGLLFHEEKTAGDTRFFSLRKFRFRVVEVFEQKRELKLVLVGSFFLFWGWYLFIKFFHVFLLDQLHFSHEQFFTVLSYFGVCSVVTQLVFCLFFYKRASHFFYVFLALLAGGLFSFLFIQKEPVLMVVVGILSLAYSVICPSLTALISGYGASDTQGKIMGLYQSVQSLAKILGPALAGLAMSKWPLAPVLLSSFFIGVSGGFLWESSRRRGVLFERDPGKIDDPDRGERKMLDPRA